MAYYREGNYTCAITHLSQAIELFPKNTDAYCKGAAVYLNKRDDERIISGCIKAIRLDPVMPTPITCVELRTLGWAMMPVPPLTMPVIELNPNNVNVYEFRRVAHCRKGYHARAKANLAKAKQLKSW